MLHLSKSKFDTFLKEWKPEITVKDILKETETSKQKCYTYHVYLKDIKSTNPFDAYHIFEDIVVPYLKEHNIDHRMEVSDRDKDGNYFLVLICKDYTNSETKSRADRLSWAGNLCDDAKSIVESLKSEIEEWKDSLDGTGFEGGDKYSALEECISSLEELENELDNIDFGSVEFPGMFS